MVDGRCFAGLTLGLVKFCFKLFLFLFLLISSETAILSFQVPFTAAGVSRRGQAVNGAP